MTGQTISHYRITAELGRGGMGIVYRAEDTKLDRMVALKLLPSSALTSHDDRARFFREARAAAALSHPNIAHIYEIDEADVGGDSRPFIAMEYIDGESLAERIARGPLPMKDAISIATQIAEGLKAAHEKNIVHRDIKSGNVMLTKSSVVKILDFGLAKTAASTKLTRMGSTLGTFAYMSPEQARGEEVDTRTDVWSLGVVLYEMITGRVPFPGEYEQAVVYGILNEDPEPPTGLRTGVPMELERIMLKCLSKDTRHRYQHVDEVGVDLMALDASLLTVSTKVGLAQSEQSNVSVISRSGQRQLVLGRRTVLLIGIAALLAGTGLGYALFSIPASVKSRGPIFRAEVVLPGMRSVQHPVLSPSLEWMAFLGSDTLSRNGIFLYEMRTGEVSYVTGTAEAAWYPAFSPDGSVMAFGTVDNGGIATSVIPGGVPKRLTSAGMGPVWVDDKTILYTDYSVGRPFRVSLEGGQPESSMQDTTLLEGYRTYMTGMIPGTKLAVGDIESNRVPGTSGALMFLNVDSGEMTIADQGIISPRYVSGGYLVYQRGHDLAPLVVRPFDALTQRFLGPPREVIQAMSWGGFNVGPDGSLLYLPRLATGPQLFIVHLSNESVESINLNSLEPVWPREPAFSPRSDRLALRLTTTSADTYIAVIDLEEHSLVRRTFEPDRSKPAWSADGLFLYYDNSQMRNEAVFRTPADGSVVEDIIVTGAGHPSASPDGRWLAVSTANRSGESDLYLVELESGHLTALDTLVENQAHPDFSPDSRYVAYETKATGSNGVAVRGIDGAGPFLLPGTALRNPKWSPDGTSLFFSSGDAIYRIGVSTSPGFRTLGRPELIAYTNGEFDINDDGTMLAVTATSVFVGTKVEQYQTIVWWQNWAKSLSESD